MPQALSLTIGINRLDPNAYGPGTEELFGCENDATRMAEILDTRHLHPKTLLGPAGTRMAVTTSIESAAHDLNSGDLFVVTFAGHGTKQIDFSGDEAATDPSDEQYDEAWCLFDSVILDDEIHNLLANFRDGVHVVVISDSCYSGTVTDSVMDITADGQERAAAQGYAADAPRDRVRLLSKDLAQSAFNRNKEFYTPIKAAAHAIAKSKAVEATCLLLSACMDGQRAKDGPVNGLFTRKLLDVWDNGAFPGTYKTFHQQIRALLQGAAQTPNLRPFGNKTFDLTAKRPFEV